MRLLARFGLLCLLPLMLTACAGDGAIEGEMDERPADILYAEASQALEDGRYQKATTLFEEFERQHPYAQQATEAQLMAAFASYKDQRYDEAILAIDRFIELHPGNDDIDYAYYLKALSFYEQISNVNRDQEMTRQALEALTTLINRFPGSEYARDAKLKRDLTLDHLAGKEMAVGRYYLRRGHVNAAINRFRNVVIDFETTTHAPEALHRLVEAYLTLGLVNEAVRVAAVLGHNYPGSDWYEKSYNLLDSEQHAQIVEDRTWVDRTVDSLFAP